MGSSFKEVSGCILNLKHYTVVIGDQVSWGHIGLVVRVLSNLLRRGGGVVLLRICVPFRAHSISI